MESTGTHWDQIELARSGHEGAQRFVVETYGPPVRGFARSRGCTPEEAEDLTQDVFVRLFTQGVLERASPERGSFRGLISTLARRVYATRRRAQGAQKRGGGLELCALNENDPAVQEAASGFDREWFAHLLEQALVRLSREHPNYYAALDLCLVQGCEQSAAAASLGRTLQDVRNHLHRGRRKLHDYLAQQIAGYAQSPRQHATEVAFLRDLLG